MTGVFDKYQKEENKKMIRLGAKIFRLYNSGKSISEIAIQTNLTEEEVKEAITGSED